MKQRLLNAAPDLALFGAILGAYLLDRFVPVAELIRLPFSYAGWLVIMFGVTFAAKSIILLRKRASSDVVRTSKTLITDDLFALSRNPLYAAELLIVTGVAVVLGSLTAFCGPVVYMMIMERFVIPFEESQLSDKFGTKYEAYTRSVRRWV